MITTNMNNQKDILKLQLNKENNTKMYWICASKLQQKQKNKTKLNKQKAARVKPSHLNNYIKC